MSLLSVAIASGFAGLAIGFAIAVGVGWAISARSRERARLRAFRELVERSIREVDEERARAAG